MFETTRIRLAMQNSIILILIIGAIAASVYSYMQVLLYSDSDDDLKDLLHQYETLVENQYIPLEASITKPTFIQDPRVQVLIWDDKKKLVQIDDEGFLFSSNPKDFRPIRQHEIEEKSSHGYYFRSISAKFSTDYGDFTVQLLRNVNSEQEMLQRVGALLALGTMVGGILAIVAGFYLAGVALVPINEALTKQKQFVSDASHELRTPLAVIQSRADLLLRSPKDTIEAKAVDISVISKETRRLSKLVSNLLLLARTDTNRLDIKKEKFRLNEAIQEVIAPYKELAELQEKKIIIKCDEPIEMFGDIERIHQLVVILLDNALKFTTEHGEINVICRKVNNGVELSVADNGIGISKKDIPYVFDRFFQGEKSRSVPEGTGLGLSIAKWIVEQHQGKIKVNSEEGKGTIFRITFPK